MFISSNESVDLGQLLSRIDLDKLEQIKTWAENVSKLFIKWLTQLKLTLTGLTNKAGSILDDKSHIINKAYNNCELKLKYDKRLVTFSRPIKYTKFLSSVFSEKEKLPGGHEYISDNMKSLESYSISSSEFREISKFDKMYIADIGNGECSVLAFNDTNGFISKSDGKFTDSYQCILKYKDSGKLKLYLSDIKYELERSEHGLNETISDIYEYSLLLPKEAEKLHTLTKGDTNGNSKQTARLAQKLMRLRSKHATAVLSSQYTILSNAIFIAEVLNSSDRKDLNCTIFEKMWDTLHTLTKVEDIYRLGKH